MGPMVQVNPVALAECRAEEITTLPNTVEGIVVLGTYSEWQQCWSPIGAVFDTIEQAVKEVSGYTGVHAYRFFRVRLPAPKLPTSSV